MKIKVNEEILLYAFRYALGRMTYSVRDVTKTINENFDSLSNRFKSTIKKEIIQKKEVDGLGMSCDQEEWLNILDVLD